MDKHLYTLPLLPYAYEALEPYIDAETMILHHDKHHATYVKNLTDALDRYQGLYEKSPEEHLLMLNALPEEIRTIVKNNAGGHVNHSLFWQSMAPGAGGQPEGELAKEINKTFGSFEEFMVQFNDAGLKRFGSGWVWLVLNKDKKLEILSTPNQDNPLTDGHLPLLGNDVWEHAYYLKYRNMRADYLKSWWNVVNWQEVARRFKP